MSWRIDGRDIVIDGWRGGIAPSAHEGFGDMRNVDVDSQPGEIAVGHKNIPVIKPPPITAMPFTVDEATDRIEWDGSVPGLYEGCAISFDIQVRSVSTLAIGGGGGGAGTPAVGGGGDGRAGGGGGAGRFRTSTPDVLPGVYPIVIGAGGAGGTGDDDGDDGQSTSGLGITSEGGGGGGRATNGGRQGASGGGGGSPNGAGGAATGGNVGGMGVDGGGADESAGGGGGAGAAGSNGTGTIGGAGGNGQSSTISGASVTYAGGGGGGGNSGTPSAGGSGGGGSGGNNIANGGNATPNTGSGGGGACSAAGFGPFNGGDGADGIFIISYPTGSLVATGGTITTSGGNTIHTFTSSGDFEVLPPVAEDTVYYVRNISGNTFQISASPISAIIDLEVFSGTFTVYQYGNQRGVGSDSNGCPVSYYVATSAEGSSLGLGIFLTDLSNYAWFVSPDDGVIDANHLLFLGNTGGYGASSTIGLGIVPWLGYLLLIGPGGPLNIISIGDFVADGPGEWDYSFTSATGSTNTQGFVPVVSAENGGLYWSFGDSVSSLIEVAGETFDPTDTNTYTLEPIALDLPYYERIESLAMFNARLFVGCRTNLIYPWDTVSPSFTFPITCPEAFIYMMVPASQTMYVFAGSKGNVYQTNGSSVAEFFSIPKGLSGLFDPYFRWRDANVNEDQIFMSFQAYPNGSNTPLTTVAGAWSLNITDGTFRMINKLSAAGYDGITRMVAPIFPKARPEGNGLYVGFTQGTDHEVDTGSSDLYDDYESYFDGPIIPIGTYFSPTTLQELEYKLAIPLATGEALKFFQRSNLNGTFEEIWETTETGQISGISQEALGSINWENVQWFQLRVQLKSVDTDPSNVRLKEVRLR